MASTHVLPSYTGTHHNNQINVIKLPYRWNQTKNTEEQWNVDEDEESQVHEMMSSSRLDLWD